MAISTTCPTLSVRLPQILSTVEEKRQTAPKLVVASSRIPPHRLTPYMSITLFPSWILNDASQANTYYFQVRPGRARADTNMASSAALLASF